MNVVPQREEVFSYENIPVNILLNIKLLNFKLRNIRIKLTKFNMSQILVKP